MSPDTPFVSVIVPVYNDAAGVELTLESVTEQTYSTDQHEILAVDNDSTDDGATRDVIRDYAQRYDHVRCLVEDDIQSSYAARNTGVQAAEGDLLAFIDADMTVETDWLDSIVISYDEHGWDYAGCEIAMYTDRETLTARYSMALRGFPVERYLTERNFCQTACLTTTQEVFDTVGDFDVRMTSHGDEEFGKRVNAAGFDQHFLDDVTVYHPARTSVRQWLGKQARIGRGGQQLRDLHPEFAEAPAPTDPRRYLPPHPGRFRKRLSAAIDGSLMTRREIAAFYVLDTASKYARTVGCVAERAKPLRSK